MFILFTVRDSLVSSPPPFFFAPERNPLKLPGPVGPRRPLAIPLAISLAVPLTICLPTYLRTRGDVMAGGELMLIGL